MKRYVTLGVLLTLGLAGLIIQAQNAPDLYQQALVQERAAGNLEQAIQLFQRAAKEASGDRSLAAKALLGAARSYEKMGSPQARKAYEEIARVYPEQREQAAMAKERFAALPATFGQATVAPMLATYCIGCHNTTKRSGGIQLDQIDPANVGPDAEVWEKVVTKLQTRAMHPVGGLRPDATTYSAAISTLQDALDRANPQPALTADTRISDLEIASRIATFLWNSEPDAALLDVARRGKLRDSATLQQQVTRMLKDPRAEKLITGSGFFTKWLHLDNLAMIQAPPVMRPEASEQLRQHQQQEYEAGRTIFPMWDEALRQALQRETELFIQDQISGDHNALDLWTANYTFLNERLARHYGISNVSGDQFRRVTLGDNRRAGLLGQGSILASTSMQTRTSPTLRGKWVLISYLGTPPPPPAPSVPPLDNTPTVSANRPLTGRERIEMHRANPSCNSCHRIIDPFGLALENFDAIGRWRDEDNGNPVNVADLLVDGYRVNGPASLREDLVQYRDRYYTNVTGKLLAYALGRGTDRNGNLAPHVDEMPVVRAILRQAKLKDYRWSSLILGIVESAPFQAKK